VNKKLILNKIISKNPFTSEELIGDNLQEKNELFLSRNLLIITEEEFEKTV
jgi:hypothetical protein